MTQTASLITMIYYVFTGILTIVFLRKRINFTILYNLIALQFVQVIAAVSTAVLYALIDEPVFSTWWGVITCMALNTARQAWRRLKDHRVAMADRARIRKEIDAIITQAINLRSRP